MNNGKGETDLLDRALRDLTPEQRARALDLTIRLGIDRDDPLWLITLAIGQLQALVETAPQDWQQTFKTFSNDLEAWTTTNLKALQAITEQAEAGAALAETSKQLTSTLTDLTRQLKEQSRLPQALRQDIRNLQKKLEAWQQTQSQTTTSITESLKTLPSGESTSSTLTALIQTSSAVSLIKWGLIGLFVLNAGGLSYLWQQQQKANQQLGWLLIKTTRLECAQQSAKKSSPLCK